MCRISSHKLSSTLCRQRMMFNCIFSTLESSNTNSNFQSKSRSCPRQFSTSPVQHSVSDMIGRMYSRHDRWKLKRKEFFNQFSASRFVNAAPDSWKSYLQVTRVDKPIGTWLLYLPCTFGICLATPLGSLPDLYHLGKILGSPQCA